MVFKVGREWGMSLARESMDREEKRGGSGRTPKEPQRCTPERNPSGIEGMRRSRHDRWEGAVLECERGWQSRRRPLRAPVPAPAPRRVFEGEETGLRNKLNENGELPTWHRGRL